MILNGWYMHYPDNWPPAKNIEPFFISFHINSTATEALIASESISYLKQYEPIGCRDLYTCHLLRKYDIESYFSGCLTLTLKVNVAGIQPRQEILFVDAVEAPYENIVETELLRYVKKVKHSFLSKSVSSDEVRFQRAEQLLERYQNALLIVTSRLHCALPALALGTPVLFMIDQQWKEDRLCRLDGLREMLNTVYVTEKREFRSTDIDLTRRISMDSIPQNKTIHLPYREKLMTMCRNFVVSAQGGT